MSARHKNTNVAFEGIKRKEQSPTNIEIEKKIARGTKQRSESSDSEYQSPISTKEERKTSIPQGVKKCEKARSLSDIIVAIKDMKNDTGGVISMSLSSIRIRDRLAPSREGVIFDFDFSAAGSCTSNIGVIQFVLLLDHSESDRGVTIPIIDVKHSKGEGRWLAHYSTRFQVPNSIRKINIGWKVPSGSCAFCKAISSPTTDFATIKYRMSIP